MARDEMLFLTKMHNNFPECSLSSFLKSVIINSKLLSNDSLAYFL